MLGGAREVEALVPLDGAADEKSVKLRRLPTCGLNIFPKFSTFQNLSPSAFTWTLLERLQKFRNTLFALVIPE